MRGVAGFGIVPRMEIEEQKTRRPRRRFSAEEKARVAAFRFLAAQVRDIERTAKALTD